MGMFTTCIQILVFKGHFAALRAVYSFLCLLRVFFCLDAALLIYLNKDLASSGSVIMATIIQSPKTSLVINSAASRPLPIPTQLKSLLLFGVLVCAVPSHYRLVRKKRQECVLEKKRGHKVCFKFMERCSALGHLSPLH